MNRTVTLPNLEELKRIGQFEPDYLPEKLA